MPQTTEARAKITKLQEAIEIRNSKIVDVHSRIERQEQHILRTQRKKERFENHLRRWNRQNKRDLRKIEELEKIVKPKPVPVKVVDAAEEENGVRR